MAIKKITFSRQSTAFHFGGRFSALKTLAPQKTSVIITDEHVAAAHKKLFKGWNTIVLPAGEEHKVQATVDSVVAQLLHLHADRTWTLVGVGGGVVTDITGYIASIYLRGIAFGFVPTSLLAMVDAAIGGKNGVDVAAYKNMVGTINQPHFLLYDTALLKTLPDSEWRNGFAEIIKHASVADAAMFKELEGHRLRHYQKSAAALQKLVQRNALLKAAIVKRDEFEKGERRLLNFGHTLGHAVEKQYALMHGEAVSVGMGFAAALSADVLRFKGGERLLRMIEHYDLPIAVSYDRQKVFDILISDKKREGEQMNFVLLQRLGKGAVKKISMQEIYKRL